MSFINGNPSALNYRQLKGIEVYGGEIREVGFGEYDDQKKEEGGEAYREANG